MMWFWIVVGVIAFAFAVMFTTRASGRKTLKDREVFDAYVQHKNLSILEQRELCERLGLEHQIGSRSYDSVEDWEKELTVIWTGETDDIEFTYRKYDDKERRTISPTEFGYDGNKKPYIRGICHNSDELRTFKTARIETKIKIGSKRFDLPEWLSTKLGIEVEQLIKDFGIKL